MLTYWIICGTVYVILSLVFVAMFKIKFHWIWFIIWYLIGGILTPVAAILLICFLICLLTGIISIDKARQIWNAKAQPMLDKLSKSQNKKPGIYCLVYDCKTETYFKLTSEWSDEHLKNVCGLDVIERFSTEEEAFKAVEKIQPKP